MSFARYLALVLTRHLCTVRQPVIGGRGASSLRSPRKQAPYRRCGKRRNVLRMAKQQWNIWTQHRRQTNDFAWTMCQRLAPLFVKLKSVRSAHSSVFTPLKIWISYKQGAFLGGSSIKGETAATFHRAKFAIINQVLLICATDTTSMWSGASVGGVTLSIIVKECQGYVNNEAPNYLPSISKVK
jgi:hypothetical protein